MGTLTYSHTLTAGSPENVNDVQDMFNDAKTVINGNINATNLANGAVTAAKIETQQAWQTLAFSITGLSGTLNYYKDSLGIVHVRGDGYTTSAGVNVASATTLVTFPAGYRPGVKSYFPILTRSTDSSALTSVTTAGVFAMEVAVINSGIIVTFSPVTFRAEN